MSFRKTISKASGKDKKGAVGGSGEEFASQADERAHVIKLWGELKSGKKFTAVLTQRLLGLPKGAVSDAPKLSELFTMGAMLGEGQSSRVYAATRRADGLRVALKVMHIKKGL